MTVHCPHCSTGYVLPDSLMGPRGARVRCPNCRRAFVVLREPGVEAATRAEPEPPAPAVASPPTAPAEAADRAPGEVVDTEPAEVAAELLDALAARLGARLGEARERNRVLAEFGPELMKAFDHYRERLGERGSREAFRAALRTRWGVDLASGPERSAT